MENDNINKIGVIIGYLFLGYLIITNFTGLDFLINENIISTNIDLWSIK